MKPVALIIKLLLIVGSGELRASVPSDSLDNDVLRLLSMIENGRMDEAYDFSKTLYLQYPGAAAVTLMFADNCKTLQPGGHVAMDPRDKFSRPLLEVLDELRIRKYQAGDQQHVGRMPSAIVQTHQATQHIIAVDLSLSRLYLLERVENSAQFAVAEYHYISIGRGGIGKVDEGDLKTPVGIYPGSTDSAKTRTCLNFTVLEHLHSISLTR